MSALFPLGHFLHTFKAVKCMNKRNVFSIAPFHSNRLHCMQCVLIKSCMLHFGSIDQNLPFQIDIPSCTSGQHVLSDGMNVALLCIHQCRTSIDQELSTWGFFFSRRNIDFYSNIYSGFIRVSWNFIGQQFFSFFCFLKHFWWLRPLKTKHTISELLYHIGILRNINF